MTRLLYTTDGFIISTPQQAVKDGLTLLTMPDLETTLCDEGTMSLVKSPLFYDYCFNLVLHVAKQQATGGKGNASIRTIDPQDYEDARGDLYCVLVEGLTNYVVNNGDVFTNDFELFKLTTARPAYMLGNAYAYRGHRRIGTPSVTAHIYDAEGNAHELSDLEYLETESNEYDEKVTEHERTQTVKTFKRVNDKVSDDLIERVHKYLSPEKSAKFLHLISKRGENKVNNPQAILTASERMTLSRLTTELLKAYNLETGNERKLKASERKEQDALMTQQAKQVKQARQMLKRLHAYTVSKDYLINRLESILERQDLSHDYRHEVSSLYNLLMNREYSQGEKREVLKPYRDTLTSLNQTYGITKPKTAKQVQALNIAKSFM